MRGSSYFPMCHNFTSTDVFAQWFCLPTSYIHTMHRLSDVVFVNYTNDQRIQYHDRNRGQPTVEVHDIR
jgi:hypothetical protein